jgi:hypothetical protein
MRILVGWLILVATLGLAPGSPECHVHGNYATFEPYQLRNTVTVVCRLFLPNFNKKISAVCSQGPNNRPAKAAATQKSMMGGVMRILTACFIFALAGFGLAPGSPGLHARYGLSD